MIALAEHARAMGDPELASALRLRGVTASGIRDFFDLAEALLASDSIQQALATLDRSTLAVLGIIADLTDDQDAPDSAPIAVDEIVDRLGRDGITPSGDDVESRVATLAAALLCAPRPDGIIGFREVSERLRSWPAEGLPDSESLTAPFPPIAVPSDDIDTRMLDRVAGERAFQTVAAVAELVYSLGSERARELGKGGLSLPDAKRLALHMNVALETVPIYQRLAIRSGLIDREGSEWLPTDDGVQWLRTATSARWLTLAASWYEDMPEQVREILASAHVPWGQPLRAYVAWLYPAAGPAVDARIDEFSADAELLGISAGRVPGTVGSLMLRGQTDEARTELTSLLPTEVTKVYAQNDLTIVAPGPLTPELDSQMRVLADVESRELASSYRITAASIGRALAAGQSADQIVDFLAGMSLTGVPQPLDYLITETAARYGRVRVGAVYDATPAKSYVRSEDDGLIGQMAVDKALSAVSLVRTDPRRLQSRFEPSVVFWALSDGRYPVVAENAAGEIVQLARRTLHPTAPIQKPDPVLGILTTLRAADADLGESGQAWLTRRIEVAIREKRTLTVSVRMPGGTISDYLLEPTSVANGRMRARDRRSDIERTLPLSSIDAIAP